MNRSDNGEPDGPFLVTMLFLALLSLAMMAAGFALVLLLCGELLR